MLFARIHKLDDILKILKDGFKSLIQRNLLNYQMDPDSVVLSGTDNNYKRLHSLGRIKYVYIIYISGQNYVGIDYDVADVVIRTKLPSVARVDSRICGLMPP